MKIRELPETDRPRERLVKVGAKALNNAELLAILLDTGTRQKTAIGLAEEILASNTVNGISRLEDVSLQELQRFQGVGIAKASHIVAAVELGKRISTKATGAKMKLNSTKDIVKIFMERMRHYNKEYFVILMLNTKSEIIREETISIGDLSTSIVHPREVFLEAIRRSAAAIALVHNHPSGNPEPSQDDIEVTERLIKAGEVVGISVLDHVIIGDGKFVSLKSRGLV
ncbi:MAG: RadC family protein [Anaerovoracaceae bacterium]